MKYIKLEAETFPAMISIDDKNYLLLTNEGKLKIHGSSLKGKHLPTVCDDFRDALSRAIFENSNPLEVFSKFQNLSHYPLEAFQIRIYPTKLDYHKNTLYAKLLRQLAANGYRVVAGAALEYVKTIDDYKPVVLVPQRDRIDDKYYKRRLAEIASRILNKPAKKLLEKLGSGQNSLGRWQKSKN